MNSTDDKADESYHICTVCNIQIAHEFATESFISHPILGVLICQKCHSHFIYDHKSKLDQTQELCLWCYKAEKLQSCGICSNKYCMKCLLANLSTDDYSKLIQDYRWLCVTCLPEQIRSQTLLCKKALSQKKLLSKNDTQPLPDNPQKSVQNNTHKDALPQNTFEQDLLNIRDKFNIKSNQLIKLCMTVNDEVEKFRSKISENFTENDSHRGVIFLEQMFHTMKATVKTWEDEIKGWNLPNPEMLVNDTNENLISAKRTYNLSIRRLADINDEFSDTINDEVIEEKCLLDEPKQGTAVEISVKKKESTSSMELVDNDLDSLHDSEESCNSKGSVFSQETVLINLSPANNNDVDAGVIPATISTRNISTTSSGSEISHAFDLSERDQNDLHNTYGVIPATCTRNTSAPSSGSETSYVFDLSEYHPNDVQNTDDFWKKEENLDCDIDNKSLHLEDHLGHSPSMIKQEEVDFECAVHNDCDFIFHVKEETHNSPESNAQDDQLKKSEFMKALHLAPNPILINTAEDQKESVDSELENDLGWERVFLKIRDNSLTLSDRSLSDLSDNESFNDEYNLPRGVHGTISYSMPQLPQSPTLEVTAEDFEDTIGEESDRLQLECIKPCSVVLHKLTIEETFNGLKNLEEHNSANETNRLLAEIENLINLDNINRKRRRSSNDTNPNTKPELKKHKTMEFVGSGESDLDSDADNHSLPIDEDRLLNDLDVDLDNDTNNEAHEQNENNWEMVIGGIINDEVDSVHGSESGVDPPAKKAKRSSSRESNKENVIEDTLSPKRENTDENSKLKSDKWKSDRLLHFGLNEETNKLPQALKDDSDGCKPKKETAKTKHLELEGNGDNYDIRSDVSDVSDDMAVINDEDEDDFDEKYGKIVINSESDSDIEFVSVERNKNTKKKTLDDIDMGPVKSDSKGRRNIRSILADETLSQSTKEANVAEKERKLRLSQKKSKMDFIMSQTDIEKTEGLILDIDEVTTQPTVVVDGNLTHRLKPHQKSGVKFMWESCYEGVKRISSGHLGSGCILAHCMGLGKTLQVIALIHTLFAHPVTKTKCVLIICPLSVVSHWKKEFEEAFKYVTKKNIVSVYDLSEDPNRLRKNVTINRWYKKGGALILGYEIFSKLTETNSKIQEALCDPGPDLIILDEGHLLKNGRSGRFASLQKVKTKRRIVLTGTPLQNNLMEYYYMIECVKPNLLGSKSEYTNRFVNPITNGQYDDSTIEDISKMKKRSHVLHKVLKDTIQRFEVTELLFHIPKRRDFAIFINLHDIQKKLYDYTVEMETDDMNSPQLRKLIRNYHRFQAIWSHIHLFRLKQLQPNKSNEISDLDQKYLSWWEQYAPKDTEKNVDYGPKIKVMLSIVNECQKIGDKVLVFTNSLTELSAIQLFLEASSTETHKWIYEKDYFRMDGATPLDKREMLCKNFNDPTNTRARLFLISIKVGGLGLNLVGANRVILMDVSWNPAVDDQGVYRICRFGQTKECYVYRLVSLGTMEEVVYERQVTKLAISARVVDCLQISRHYKSGDLAQIYRSKFIYDPPRPIQAPPDDNVLANVYRNCPEIYKYHNHQSLLENLPEENLNETEMKLAWDEFNEENRRQEQQLQDQQNKIAAMQAAAALNNQNRSIENRNLPNLPKASYVINPVALTTGGLTSMLPHHLTQKNPVIQSKDVQKPTNVQFINIANNSLPIQSPHTTNNKPLTTIPTSAQSIKSQLKNLQESSHKPTNPRSSVITKNDKATVGPTNGPSPFTINNNSNSTMVTPPQQSRNVPEMTHNPTNPQSSLMTKSDKVTVKPTNAPSPFTISNSTMVITPQQSKNVQESLHKPTNPQSVVISRNSKVTVVPTNAQSPFAINNSTMAITPQQSRNVQESLHKPTNPQSVIISKNSKVTVVPTNAQSPFAINNNSTMPKHHLTAQQSRNVQESSNKPANLQPSQNHKVIGIPTNAKVINIPRQNRTTNPISASMQEYVTKLVQYGRATDAKESSPTSNTPSMRVVPIGKVTPLKQKKMISVTPAVIGNIQQLISKEQKLPNNSTVSSYQSLSKEKKGELQQVNTRAPAMKSRNPPPSTVQRITEAPLSTNSSVIPTVQSVINLDDESDNDIRKKQHHALLTSLNSNANLTISAIGPLLQEKTRSIDDVIEID